MVDEKIVEYLKEGIKRGFDIKLLKRKLLDNGFNEADILEAINLINRTAPNAPNIPMIKTPSGIKQPEKINLDIEEDKTEIFKRLDKKVKHS